MGVLAPVSAQARPSARASIYMSDIFWRTWGGKLLCWSHTLFQTKIQKDIIRKNLKIAPGAGTGGGMVVPQILFLFES